MNLQNDNHEYWLRIIPEMKMSNKVTLLLLVSRFQIFIGNLITVRKGEVEHSSRVLQIVTKLTRLL